MTELHIADRLRLPLDAVTSTFAVLGIRGSGKTHTATVLVEEMLRAGQPVCVYDPTGAWFGLKSAADGRRPGFPVVLFGGEHADLPLEETAGAVVARVVAERRTSVVLDTSLLRKAARTRFMQDFCETLYHKNREPLHFVADEAHTIAPQRVFPEGARLLGAVEDIVLQGRRRGLGCTLISQRPALVSKNVLTQCGTLIALRLVGPQDRAAVEDWVEAHADKALAKELLASLPSLARGEGWVWSPGWLRTMQRVTFRPRQTFDSSATPEVGKRAAAPQATAPIDLDALGEEIRATAERAKADDPAELRRRIAELEKRIRQQAPDPSAVERAVQAALREQDARHAAWENRVARLTADLVRRLRSIAELAAAPDDAWDVQPADRVADKKTTPKIASEIAPAAGPAAAPVRETIPNGIPKTPQTSSGTTVVTLPKAQRLVLTALAQHGACTKAKVAILAGYAVGGGGFNNALSALRGAGYVEGRGDTLAATDAGLRALGRYDPLPTGQELFRHWYGQLPKAERNILAVLVSAYPAPMTKENVAAAAGYEPNGGGFNNALSRLRTLELISRGAELRAADALF